MTAADRLYFTRGQFRKGETMTRREEERGDVGHGQSSARLCAGLEKSLSAYANAAAAAGVGLLALAVPAEGKIVYTPANLNIPINGGLVPLDLNHDGVADFSFNIWTASGADSNPECFSARAKANQIWGRGKGSSFCGSIFAGALRRGFKVGPNKSYFNKNTGSRWLMAFSGSQPSSRSFSYGQWLSPAQHRYLGLKFTAGGNIHYGWARFNVGPHFTVTLTGYAYETIPNKPIITGKTKGPDVITLAPASLGHLAQGASGIPVWRKSGGSWKPVVH